MDQDEHLTENSQPKFITRCTARHLRRKRMNAARRSLRLSFTNGVTENTNHESIDEKEIEYPEVITKSKARRLREKYKPKEIQPYCSSCNPTLWKSNIYTTVNPEHIDENNTESRERLTKSKARRLRKKNKARLPCFNCCHPDLFYSPCLCFGCVSGEQSCQFAKRYTEVEQLEPKSQNLESEKDISELSCSSESSSLVRLGNEVQANCAKHHKHAEELVFASQLKQQIENTIRSRNSCTQVDTQLQTLDLQDSCTLQELEEPVLVKSLQSSNICIVDCNKVGPTTASPSIESKESVTTSLNKDHQENTELQSYSEEGAFKTIISLQQESIKAPCDISVLIDNTKLAISTAAIKDDATVEKISTDLVPNSCSVVTRDNNPLKEENVIVSTVVETPPIQSCVIESNTVAITNVESGSKSSTSTPQSTTRNKMTGGKLNVAEKTRDEVKAEREAKKAAKAAAKAKAKTGKTQEKQNTTTPIPSDKVKDEKNDDVLENKNNENVTLPDKTSTINKTPTVNKCPSTCVKDATSDVKNEGKSKAEVRAERRAKQEAQRAAKQQSLSDKCKPKNKEADTGAQGPITTDVASPKKPSLAVPMKKTILKENAHEVNLFKHLYHERETAFVDIPRVNSYIHPAIVRLGTQYANKVIVGSNARCVALLAAVKQLIQDFERPSQADFIRGLEASLQESVAYLHHCRPIAVSMQNSLRHLKWQMTQLPSTLSDIDAKHKLGSAIDTYILEQIQLADEAISITIQTKISNGDVILTYAYSSLIYKILLDAHNAGKKFRVIIVDGRPWQEGKEQLRRLAKQGIDCSYILINALSFVMPEVSKVFLGAYAILANGAVMSRVGTAQVALMAKAFNVPVLVACETHKSCERVQTDSIVYNELGNADELVENHRSDSKPLLANWRTKRSLNLLNIIYDVTPADLVTAVVTELAILPCTSVPVILRIKPSEI